MQVIHGAGDGVYMMVRVMMVWVMVAGSHRCGAQQRMRTKVKVTSMRMTQR